MPNKNILNKIVILFYKLIYSKTLLVKNTFAAYFDSKESIFGCSHPLQLTNFSRVGMILDFIIIYYTMLKPFKMKIFFKSYSTIFYLGEKPLLVPIFLGDFHFSP